MYFPARVPGPVETKSLKLNFAWLFFLFRLVEAMTPPDTSRMNRVFLPHPPLTTKVFQLTESAGCH
jgi:hypothetical protein